MAKRAFTARLAFTVEACTSPVLGFAVLKPSGVHLTLAVYWWETLTELHRESLVIPGRDLGVPRRDVGDRFASLDEIDLLAFERTAWTESLLGNARSAENYMAKIYKEKDA